MYRKIHGFQAAGGFRQGLFDEQAIFWYNIPQP